MGDRIYCYPGTDVLINKYDIRDAETLNATEKFRTQLRYAQLQASPIKGDFDVAHIKAVHYHLFQDMYTWAGQFRTLNISKSTDFCRYPYIESYLTDVLDKLCRDNYLVGTSQELFAKKLAFYFAEINAVHPYREGNGRCQRAFMMLLAKVAGYDINFDAMTEAQMTEASIYSWKNDESKFVEMFIPNIVPISKGEQMAYAMNILSTKNRVLKNLVGN